MSISCPRPPPGRRGPVGVAVVERHHHRVGGVEGGHAVREHERRQRRRAVGGSGEVGEAAHRLAEGAEPGPVGLRAAGAVPGDVHHDQPRVGGGEALVLQVPFPQRGRSEVHDQHVGLAGERPQQLAPGLEPQVEGDALLVAGHALPHQPDPVALRSPLPQRVAAVGLLDLDHLGPLLAHPGGDQRPGREGGGVDHPQAGQGAVGHCELLGSGRYGRGGGQPGALGGGRPVRRRVACLPGYEPVFILMVTRLSVLQSKVPGLVGSTRVPHPVIQLHEHRAVGRSAGPDVDRADDAFGVERLLVVVERVEQRLAVQRPAVGGCLLHRVLE